MPNKNLIVIAGLVVGAVFAIDKGVVVKKDAEIAASQIVVQEQQSPSQKNTAVVSSEDIIMARKLIEYSARANGVPVRVQLHGQDIIITSAPEPVKNEQTEDKGAPATNLDKESIKEDKAVTLGNYRGIHDFLYTLAGLPYALTRKSICIGEGCSNAAIEIVLTVEGKPQTTAPVDAPATALPGKG